ncbi:hypothetical protein BH09CHL1_BH09CHL1_06970 [soil metagenome]
MAERFSDRSGHPRNAATRMAARVGFGVLIAVLVLFAARSDDALGAGPLVVVEDVSSLGSGAFSGSVCFQVIRDGDGAVISENCVGAAATFTAPDGLEIGIPYSISISLSDPNCELLDDSRVSDGSVPFAVRVSCDPAFLTATAAAQPTFTPIPLPTETPTPLPTPTSTSSPEPSRTPMSTPTAEPTPTLEPTFGVTPTIEPEIATPVSEVTAIAEEGDEIETAGNEQSLEMTSPQVVDLQFSQLNSADALPRVQGTITVSYEIAPSPGATVSVLFSIGNLETGATAIVPGDIMLVRIGVPDPIGDAELATNCAPLTESFQPISLETAAPVISCTGSSSGQFQQVIVFEFTPGQSVSLDSYAGSISLTMTIAP